MERISRRLALIQTSLFINKNQKHRKSHPATGFFTNQMNNQLLKVLGLTSAQTHHTRGRNQPTFNTKENQSNDDVGVVFHFVIDDMLSNQRCENSPSHWTDFVLYSLQLMDPIFSPFFYSKNLYEKNKQKITRDVAYLSFSSGSRERNDWTEQWTVYVWKDVSHFWSIVVVIAIEIPSHLCYSKRKRRPKKNLFQKTKRPSVCVFLFNKSKNWASNRNDTEGVVVLSREYFESHVVDKECNQSSLDKEGVPLKVVHDIYIDTILISEWNAS